MPAETSQPVHQGFWVAQGGRESEALQFASSKARDARKDGDEMLNRPTKDSYTTGTLCAVSARRLSVELTASSPVNRAPGGFSSLCDLSPVLQHRAVTVPMSCGLI
jgi:hypothetical protein